MGYLEQFVMLNQKSYNVWLRPSQTLVAAKQIINERRKREIEPILALLEDLKKVEGNKNDKKHKKTKSKRKVWRKVNGVDVEVSVSHSEEEN